MSEFDEEMKKPEEQENPENGDTREKPEYGDTQENKPENNNGNQYGTYYTPPEKKEEPKTDNTTYHYSYVNQDNNTSASRQGADWNNTNQNNTNTNTDSYYHQSSYSSTNENQNIYQQANTAQTENNSGENKPKKSKVGVVILIVVIVCVCIAAAGIIGSVISKSTSSDDTGDSTAQSQQSDSSDVTTKDSSNVATVDSEGNYTVAGVAEKCMDYCVGITVYSQQAEAYSYFYGYGYGSQGNGSDSSEPTESGEGSGVIMSESNGKTYIMTCAHVISDGDSFKVTLNDKTEYDAQMVAYDSQTDIGVLSIDATGLKAAEFADSSSLAVGEQVVAIGCPGGLEFMNSVTSGYISALDRPVSSSIGYDNNCIQTDAAINPGNSGGALFNMQGQVIGINSSKIASTEYEGMGFAVPSSTAVSTANSLIKSGYVEGRAKIGIQYNLITSFNNSSAILNALAEKGYKDANGTMVINSIDDSSSLKNEDIKQYDMIVAVNGETMTSTDILTSILSDSKPGDTIKLTIARIENNEIKIFDVDCTLIESKG